MLHYQMDRRQTPPYDPAMSYLEVGLEYMMTDSLGWKKVDLLVVRILP